MAGLHRCLLQMAGDSAGQEHEIIDSGKSASGNHNHRGRRVHGLTDLRLGQRIQERGDKCVQLRAASFGYSSGCVTLANDQQTQDLGTGLL